MTTEPSPTLTIDIVSDVVCPWCYIGKRRLEAALATLAADDPGRRPRIRWHPFQLNPDIPAEGMDRRAYLEAKFGGPARAAQIYERVRAAGRTVDIPFAFEAIARQPNTQNAHRLIAWTQTVADAAVVDALVERLFRAYFLEGCDVGDPAELVRIGSDAGLDAAATLALLASERFAPEVRESNARAHQAGIDGVPFIIFDGKVAVGGAQEPGVLLDAIAQADRAVATSAGG